jgi:hypothetical protein
MLLEWRIFFETPLKKDFRNRIESLILRKKKDLEPVKYIE